MSDEKYIQIDDADDATLRPLWAKLTAEYPGFNIDFCYHNNIPPDEFFKEIGAKISDDCIELHLKLQDFKSMPFYDVVIITESNFNDFAELHDKKNPDMYWNSARLKKDLSQWDILKNNCGYILVRNGWEIYALYAENAKDMTNLLNAAITRSNIKERDILFMIDRNEHMQLDVALKIGFRQTGYYISYSIKIAEE